MTNPADFPRITVIEHSVYKFAENVIDKKIANIALNLFESFIDYVATKLSYSYSQLESDKRARVHIIHGVPLYDDTLEKIVTVQDERHLSFTGLEIILPTLKPNAFYLENQKGSLYFVVENKKNENQERIDHLIRIKERCALSEPTAWKYWSIDRNQRECNPQYGPSAQEAKEESMELRSSTLQRTRS